MDTRHCRAWTPACEQWSSSINSTVPCGSCRWRWAEWCSVGRYCPSGSWDDPETPPLWSPAPPGSSAAPWCPSHHRGSWLSSGAPPWAHLPGHLFHIFRFISLQQTNLLLPFVSMSRISKHYGTKAIIIIKQNTSQNCRNTSLARQLSTPDMYVISRFRQRRHASSVTSNSH